MKQVAINFILVTSIVAIGSCQNPESDYPPPGGGEQTGQGTDQGWDYATAQAWYHIDQGTAFFPYEWFVALEQTGGQERFATPGHMQRFGFLSNPPHQAYNPDGLPIGFSRTELHLDKGPFQCWQGNWVGLTCAACHTSQVNYHGTSLLIEGGPAHNDIETFRANLAQAFAANASNPEKAQRFVGRILAQQPELSPADVQAGLQCFGKASMARARFEQEALAAADEPPSAAGPARLDALGRGGNSLFAESTGTVGNYKPTTAPVSFPALWDTPYFDWVLYNNSVRQPLARSVVEALGVGAPMDLSTLNAPELRHNVQMDNLVDIQLWLQDLKSPKWPEPVLGDIDQDLADRGAEVYGANCASCHQVIDRDAHDASCAVPDGGRHTVVSDRGGRHRSAPGGQLRDPRNHARAAEPAARRLGQADYRQGGRSILIRQTGGLDPQPPCWAKRSLIAAICWCAEATASAGSTPLISTSCKARGITWVARTSPHAAEGGAW